MKALTRRLRRLEDHMVPAAMPNAGTVTRHHKPLSQDRSIQVYNRADRKLALDEETCVRILRQGGFVPQTEPGEIAWVQLSSIPEGLNAQELAEYLKEHGQQICHCLEFSRKHTHQRDEGDYESDL
jgi:hypothetical protein